MGAGQSQAELDAIAHGRRLQSEQLEREFRAGIENSKREQQEIESQREHDRLQTNAVANREMQKEQLLREAKNQERDALERKRQAMEAEQLMRNKFAEEKNRRAEDIARDVQQREQARREREANVELERQKMVQKSNDYQKTEDRLRENAAEDRRLKREQDLRQEKNQEQEAVERRRQAIEKEQLERNKLAEESNKRAEAAYRESTQSEDSRRERELKEEIERSRRIREERENQRKEALQREDAERKQQMENEKELLKERRKEREAAKQRQQEREMEQYHRKLQAEQDAQAKIIEQKNFNQAEIKEKTSEHNVIMVQKAKQKTDTETKFNEAAVKLNEEKKLEQEKLHNDAKQHDERRMETSRQHFTAIDKQRQRNHEVELEIAGNLQLHEERMNAGINNFRLGQLIQAEVGAFDETEDHFIDSVNSTRSTGRDVVNAVHSIGKHAYCLRQGVRAPENTIQSLQVAIKRTEKKIAKLTESVKSMREQQESRHKEVLTCQAIAEKIQASATNLSNSISRFGGSLAVKGPIDDSPELFEKVVQDVKELDKLLSSFPVVSKSNYTVGAIMGISESLAGPAKVVPTPGKGTHLENSTTGLAIEDKQPPK